MTVLSNIITPSNVLTTTNTATVTNKTFGDNPTFSGGTANGVTYLNGSKVLTSGSALVFDGTNLGIGNTPSAWTNSRAIQFGNFGAVSQDIATSGGMNVSYNCYATGATTWFYRVNAFATRYAQEDGIHKWFSAASGTAGNAISFTQAMTLDASGNLAVGTTTAQITGAGRGNITLNGSSSAIINLSVGDVNKAQFYHGGTDMFIGNQANGYLMFQTNATERARIDSSGNFFVDCTDYPNGSTRRGFEVLANSGVNDTTKIAIGTTTTSTRALVELNNGNGNVGSISVTGSATSYNTSSDYRLKDNQQPLTGSGSFIDALQPKTWSWKADGSKGVGFIAHEAQAVSPSSVIGEKDAIDEEGKPIMQAMEYGSAEFIANIIAELQSLRQRLAVLEAK